MTLRKNKISLKRASSNRAKKTKKQVGGDPKALARFRERIQLAQLAGTNTALTSRENRKPNPNTTRYRYSMGGITSRQGRPGRRFY